MSSRLDSAPVVSSWEKRAMRSSPCSDTYAWLAIAQPLLRRPEVLVEELDRPLPRHGGGGPVVARGRVVVEAVLRPGIAVHRVRHVARLERRLVGGPALVHAIVVVRVVDQERRLDLGNVRGRRLRAV